MTGNPETVVARFVRKYGLDKLGGTHGRSARARAETLDVAHLRFKNAAPFEDARPIASNRSYCQGNRLVVANAVSEAVSESSNGQH